MFTGGSLILTEKTITITTQANISYDKDGYLKRNNFGYPKFNDKTFYNYYLYF